MAVTFVDAIIVQHGNDVKLVDGVFGEAGVVPTPSAGGLPDGDYWAVPVNNGSVSGLTYNPTIPGSTDAPDIQAFHVFRLLNRFSSDVWYVIGTTQEYTDAAHDAECCTESSPPNLLPTGQITVAPCQQICADGDGVFTAILGLPTLAEGEAWFPFGFLNGVALTAASGAGYASAGALETFLNANWLTGNLAATWDVSADNKTLTNTLAAGDDNDPDVLCAAVIVV